MKSLFFLEIIFVIYLCDESHGAKILILHPIYTGSHVLTLGSLADSITERGHQVHIVKWKDQHTYPPCNNTKIITRTLAMDNSKGTWTWLTKETNASFLVPHELTVGQGVSWYPNFKSILGATEAIPFFKSQCDALLSNKQLYYDLQKEKFDLAIIDIIYNDCGLALLHQLKVPTVGFWGVAFSSGEPEYTTAFLPSSHVPAWFSKFGDEMTFLERTLNLLLKTGSHLVMSTYFFMINLAVQKHYPGTPHPADLLKDINGMIINLDPVIHYPRLLPPTFIEVGGVQIRSPKPLPFELEKWMQSSGEHGVVLVGMGFTHDLKLVTENVLTSFLKVFSRFPQKFLIKLEKSVDNVPPNVKILEWIPQQDILGHPKTKAFISHCAGCALLETVYHKVPIICMPLGLDQGDFTAVVINKGFGVGLDKDSATEEDIYQSLKEVLHNPIYKSNVQKLSNIMRDRKETPKERSVDYIEYMLRHKGAEHLKLASRHLNWIQYFSLDTLAFLIIAAILIPYILFKALRFILRFVRSSKNADKIITKDNRKTEKLS